MFDTLVTYHVHRQDPLPPNDAQAYQYVLAGNGLFVRATTRFFRVLMPVAPCPVRGLAPLRFRFRLAVPRVPAGLLAAVLADAANTRGSRGDLHEALYHFHHLGRTVQVLKPPQRATHVSVVAAHDAAPALFCQVHSHGALPAFWSDVDDADEQGAGLYAVAGRVDARPELRLRVGVYGMWHPLPVRAVFTGRGGFADVTTEEAKG